MLRAWGVKAWRKDPFLLAEKSLLHMFVHSSPLYTWEFWSFYGAYESDGVLMDLMRHKYNELLDKILSYLMLMTKYFKSLSSYFVDPNPLKIKHSSHYGIFVDHITFFNYCEN